MKLIELLNKIANGEIKKGAKIKKNNFTYIFEDNNFYRNEIRDLDLFDVSKLNDEVEIIEEKQQQGRWKPKEGERYWFIDSCEGIYRSTWSSAKFNNWRYITKNIFKTEKEAAEYLEYKKALLEAEKPFVEEEENYFIKLEEGNIEVAFTWASRYAGVICLGQDKDVAQAFVDKWEKQILKYEFGIEE